MRKPPFQDRYNAAEDLIERNVAARSNKTAYIDEHGRYSFADLAERVNRCANALSDLGLNMEARVLVCLLDTIDFPAVFLGAIKAGLVPIAVNTLLTSSDFDFMLRDSRAQALAVSETLLPVFEPILRDQPFLKHVVVSGEKNSGHQLLADLMAKASSAFAIAPTRADDPCFWLYSSGSTGTPKGVVHVHTSMTRTAELYAQPILGIQETDVVFSAAKLFFAYGLGNALSFPLSVGATTILLGDRPTPAAVCRILREHRPTIFYGVPTLYSALLASAGATQTRGSKSAPLHIRRRGAAAGSRQALARSHRRGYSRRPGLHRDAAYFFVEPSGRSPLRYHRQAGARLRHSPGR